MKTIIEKLEDDIQKIREKIFLSTNENNKNSLAFLLNAKFILLRHEQKT